MFQNECDTKHFTECIECNIIRRSIADSAVYRLGDNALSPAMGPVWKHPCDDRSVEKERSLKHNPHLHHQPVHQRHPQYRHQQHAGHVVLYDEYVAHGHAGLRVVHPLHCHPDGILPMAHRPHCYPPSHRRRLQQLLQKDFQKGIHNIFASVLPRRTFVVPMPTVAWQHGILRTETS